MTRNLQQRGEEVYRMSVPSQWLHGSGDKQQKHSEDVCIKRIFLKQWRPLAEIGLVNKSAWEFLVGEIGMKHCLKTM